MSTLVCVARASERSDYSTTAAGVILARARRALALSALFTAATSCGDPLVARELVTGNRVLGARVEATATPGFAWIAPSQSATVRWFVVGPASPPAFAWTFSLCAAEPVSRGLPRCAAPVFSRFSQAEPSVLEPQFEFTMPNDEGLGGATQLTVNGAFCESGLPSTDGTQLAAESTRCPDRKERPLLSTTGIFVAREGNTNQNPSFDQVALTLDNSSWPIAFEVEAQEPTCLQLVGVVPTVKAGTTGHEIALSVPDDLSETLETVSNHSSGRETLQLSHYVTAGALERSFSDIASSSPTSRISLGWVPPTEIADGGQLVRFFFVLRDGRGGADWIRRALCVVP